jgi:hypothetical protein
MVPQMLAAGARIVGGCCGTTPGTHEGDAGRDRRPRPDEPGGARRTWRRRPGPKATAGAGPRPESSDLAADPAAPRGRPARGPPASGDATPPSGLARKLADGSFVISVEIDPPRSIRIDRTIEAARLLKEAGVDLVNISDSATGRVRMGAMAVAFGIQQQLDLECLVHLTTRDRNLMALEAELLGAHALGVRNILALTGDPPRVADRPATTAVWDVDAIGLIEIIRRLNKGEDGAGLSIGQAAGFTIACALDSTAADPNKEWSRLERKLAAGANLIMTQPLYSQRQVDSMLARSRECFGGAASRCRCCSAFCRSTAPATPSSCTTRSRHHDPRRAARGHARGRRTRRRGRPRNGDEPAGRVGGSCNRHLHHAELRPLRAGRRAGPALARPPGGGKKKN